VRTGPSPRVLSRLSDDARSHHAHAMPCSPHRRELAAAGAVPLLRAVSCAAMLCLWRSPGLHARGESEDGREASRSGGGCCRLPRIPRTRAGRLAARPAGRRQRRRGRVQPACLSGVLSSPGAALHRAAASRLLHHHLLQPPLPPAMPQRSSSTDPRAVAVADLDVVHAGWVLKKKRKKMQGEQPGAARGASLCRRRSRPAARLCQALPYPHQGGPAHLLALARQDDARRHRDPARQRHEQQAPRCVPPRACMRTPD
jgi:hypothetical protein